MSKAALAFPVMLLALELLWAAPALCEVASPRMTYPGAFTGRFAPRQDLPDWMRVPRWYTKDSPRWGKGETAALVHELADHNANAFRLGMMWGGRAHYPSEVAPWRPSLEKGVDPLAEAMATAKERGVHILTYINPNAVYDDHPLYDEICVRAADGSPQERLAYGREGTRYVCFNNPAFERFYTAALREIFTRYSPDGLYVDGLTPHVCLCRYCRETFRRDTGRDLPAALASVRRRGVLWEMTSDWDVVGDPTDPEIELYSRWMMSRLADMTRIFTETVKGIKPGAVTVYHTWPKPDNMRYYDGTLNEIYLTRPWHFTLWKRAEFANWGDAFEVPSLVNIYLRQQPWKQPERRAVTSETEARHMYWQTLAQGAFPNSWAVPGMTQPFAVMRDHADCFDFPTIFPLRFLAFPRAMFLDARMRKLSEAASLPLIRGSGARLRVLEREPGGKIDLLGLRADGRPPSDAEYRGGDWPDDVIYVAAHEYHAAASQPQADGARWERHDDPGALSGGYVTSQGHGRGVPQTHLDYVLPEIKRAGRWALWARVIFPNPASDSFHWQISNDGGNTWLPATANDDCAVGWEQPQEYGWVKGRAQPSGGDGNIDRFLSPHAGMYAGLLHARLPIKQIHPNHLTAESLEGFRVLVLANEACLSDEQCALIRRFVARGGGLVATHETSLYDMRAEQRRDFGLADVLGVSFDGEAMIPAKGQRIVPTPDSPVAAALPPEGLENHEEHLIVKPTRARVIARLLGPGVPGDGIPAMLAHEYRRGRVVYLPGRSDSSYSYWADEGFPRLIAAAVEWACRGELPVRVEGDGLVGVTLFEQPSRHRWLIHLLNFSAPWSESFDHVEPIANLRVTVRPPGDASAGDVRAVLSDAQLRARWDRGEVTFTLPRLDEYEIVTVRWAR